MVSEKHDTNLITYWLREILRHGAPVPPEVDCDYSMALLNAISLAFNERNLKNFISDCYRWICGETLHYPLQIYIRIDIAHLIKIICNKNVFNKKLPKVKDFFVRCVGISSTCDNIEDFRKILYSIFIVAYSEYDGKDMDGNNVLCADRRLYLFERIKSFTFVSEDENRNDKEYDNNLETLEEDENIVLFINSIRQKAEENAKKIPETNTYNALYCPELADYLIKLAKHFPLWTQIMSRYFPSQPTVATSSRCEAYFKDLKHYDLGSNYEPLRVDKFIIRHIKSIESISKLELAAHKRKDGKMAILQTEMKKEKRIKIDYMESNENNCEHLKEQENWKGLNMEVCKKSEKTDDINSDTDKENDAENSLVTILKSVKQQKPLTENNSNIQRGKYLNPCPDIELMYNRPLRRRKNEILRNGNNCNVVHINGKKLYIKNTCAFDSITEIFTNAYCNYSKFKNWIDTNSDNIFLTFMKNYAVNNVNKTIYEERGAILCTIFEIDNDIVDCTTNSNYLFTKLITDICSAEEIKTCKCGY